MRTLQILLAAALLALGVTDAAAQATPPLPADSLALGRTWARLFREQKADSLHAFVVAGASGPLATAAGLGQLMGTVFDEGGAPGAIIEERFAWRGGARQFWTTYTAANVAEPIVLRFVMRPDGRMSGLGVTPASGAPAADSAGPVIRPARVPR